MVSRVRAKAWEARQMGQRKRHGAALKAKVALEMPFGTQYPFILDKFSRPQ